MYHAPRSQSQLTLLNLNSARVGSPRLPRRPSLSLLTLKRLRHPPGILDLLLCSATCSSCARTSMSDPLGAAPPDIVLLGSYMPPSSVTFHTPTLQANVTAWAEAALNKIRAFKVSAEVRAVSTPGH